MDLERVGDPSAQPLGGDRPRLRHGARLVAASGGGVARHRGARLVARLSPLPPLRPARARPLRRLVAAPGLRPRAALRGQPRALRRRAVAAAGARRAAAALAARPVGRALGTTPRHRPLLRPAGRPARGVARHGAAPAHRPAAARGAHPRRLADRRLLAARDGGGRRAAPAPLDADPAALEPVLRRGARVLRRRGGPRPLARRRRALLGRLPARRAVLRRGRLLALPGSKGGTSRSPSGASPAG